MIGWRVRQPIIVMSKVVELFVIAIESTLSLCSKSVLKMNSEFEKTDIVFEKSSVIWYDECDTF